MEQEGKKIVIKRKNDPSSPNGDASLSYDQDNESTQEPIILKSPFEHIESDEFAQLLEESFRGMDPIDNVDPNQLVEGTVVKVVDDYVFMDIGKKSEGFISIKEFQDGLPDVGDKLKVVLKKFDPEMGANRLSKREADLLELQLEIKHVIDSDQLIKGKVTKAIKGGFVVTIKGFDAFLPKSQADIRKVQDDDLIGKTFEFKIEKFDRKSKNLVLNRRKILENELDSKMAHFFAHINEGDIIKGNIKTLQDYGVFVNINDVIDGFVHISDLSWGRMLHPSEQFNVGDEVKAKVINIDAENKKISLSLKALLEDPWEIFAKEHNAEDVVEGEIVKLSDFGAFVRVMDGVEGLIHVSEMSWTKRISHPKEILKAGDLIQAKILEIDLKNRRLSLGLRQVLPNPWDTIEEKYPIGSRVKGTVKRFGNNGAYLEIQDDMFGFLHQNDLEWSNKNKPATQQLKKDQSIETLILDIKKGDHLFILGVKQLSDNPWEKYIQKHPKGSFVKGKITRISDNGMTIYLDKDIEGFVHKSHVSNKPIERISQIFALNQEVDLVIIEVDLKKNRILLSAREFEKRMEKKTVQDYLKKGSSSSGFSMASIIKDKLN